MKFKVGDPVWAKVNHPELGKGELAAIVIDCRPDDPSGYQYRIEIPGHPPDWGIGWASKENWLRRRRDDDVKLVDWSECVWRPKHLEAA